MNAEHVFELQAKCPIDDWRDIYQCKVVVSRILKCEEIIEVARGIASEGPIFQEDLTQKIANALLAYTTTVGLHKCGVKTTVFCSPE